MFVCEEVTILWGVVDSEVVVEVFFWVGGSILCCT